VGDDHGVAVAPEGLVEPRRAVLPGSNALRGNAGIETKTAETGRWALVSGERSERFQTIPGVREAFS